ncbi:MAG: NTP transferase domain-containing protein [Candidatus Zixiibacteriota bacterium]|nr:MAG: NTP transferase domain-containing protein [candidate division Zixibacteria bacterium]
MKAIIMAGGFGTRLRPLTINTPKPMVPVGNLPMMEHVVALLRKHDIRQVTSLLYFQPETIRSHFGDGGNFGVSMTYCLPDEDLGTAGSVRYALEDSQETILVISGDLITDFDLSEAIAWHKDKGSEATLLLTRAENPLAYGIVITEDSGRIVRFLEKPSWGEAFSDTINTGIYILEPSAVRLIPTATNFDFSQNLYPLMLSRGMGLYGKVMDGYWKDVGNVDEYRLAHHDLYTGSVELDLKSERVEYENGVLYKRGDVHIEGDVDINGTVVLGEGVVVGPGSNLRNCTIGPHSTIGPGCRIRETTIWSGVSIGKRSTCNSSIVCNRSRLGENVQLLDKTIVSDDCTLGNSVMVRANCRIWPDKTVEDGATVTSSMVWGEKWNRELFTDSKVTGLALSEISPDMCVRLGAAFGASLGQNAAVITARDASDITRLLRRAFISGLLASGTNVSDIEAMPSPVVRYALSKGGYAAGMYMRHNPLDYRQLDIIVFDGNGLDMPTAKLKKIERNYFGEDFERASLDSIGHLDMPQRVIDDYRQEFLSHVDVDLVKSAGFKIVIDHSNGSSSQIFPTLFSLLGVNATELNAGLNPRKFSTSLAEQSRSIVQLSAIVKSLNADLGVALNPSAEKLTVVDDRGKPIDSDLLLLLVTDLCLRVCKPKAIAVPVSASMGVEEIAGQHGVDVIRVPNRHRDMMEIMRQGKVEFVGGTRGGFIFPGFQTGADAMMATVRILELLARTRSRFAELRSTHEHFVRSSVSVPCPWPKKGLVMRRLIYESSKKDRQLVDGVRIFEDRGWVLVAPDRFKASFNITAESTSAEMTATLLNRYRSFVEDSQQN